MRKLKIFNCSEVDIQLEETAYNQRIGDKITIAPGDKHKYLFDRELDFQCIRLTLPHQYAIEKPYICLFSDFMEANKIAYVRRGDDDRWFVDPVSRAAKLVKKRLCNSTISQIALVEYVLERTGETQRVPEKNDSVRWTAWWEIKVDSRTKHLLIVDPVAVEKEHRKYFVREGSGPRLQGSIDDVNRLRRQSNNVNGDMHEIIMTQCNERFKVKQDSRGMLNMTSLWRPQFLV